MRSAATPGERWQAVTNRITSPAFRTTRCASRIRQRLYLSNYGTASNAEELQKLGITHIISVLDKTFPLALPDIIPSANRLFIPLADKPQADILVHLDETTSFIRMALEEDDTNVVLVHCMQGISRSATVVCAYLIATEGLEAHEAIDAAQAQRSVVCPNLGFRLQLVQYAERFPKTKPNPLGKELIQRIRKLLVPKPDVASIVPAGV